MLEVLTKKSGKFFTNRFVKNLDKAKIIVYIIGVDRDLPSKKPVCYPPMVALAEGQRRPPFALFLLTARENRMVSSLLAESKIPAGKQKISHSGGNFRQRRKRFLFCIFQTDLVHQTSIDSYVGFVYNKREII